MKRVFIQTPIGYETQWVYDVVYVNGNEPMEVVRGYTIGLIGDEGRYNGCTTIFEKPSIREKNPETGERETIQGDFVYASGKLVENRDHLMELPEPHRERAIKWFDEKYGVPKPKEPEKGPDIDEIPPEPEKDETPKEIPTGKANPLGL